MLFLCDHWNDYDWTYTEEHSAGVLSVEYSETSDILNWEPESQRIKFKVES